MTRWVALLRGINVGGRNRLPMAELTAIAQSLGWDNLQHYIQSGNLVFDADTPDGETLSARIEAEKGFAPQVLIISLSEFERIMDACPFESETGKDVHVFFLGSCAEPNIAKLEALRSGQEKFALDERAFYLFAPEGIGRSKLAAGAEKALGVPATARNWNTILALKAML